MTTRDVFQMISDMDSDMVQKIVDRLEFRGSDPTFVRMRETYLENVDLQSNARVLELGCGTGVVSRALAQRKGFTGAVVATDFSDELIKAARNLADNADLSDRIEFRVGDSHALEEPDNSYDVVLAHTLVSHVVDPAAVVSEASRVARPGGTIVVFDGDYASLTFGAGDPELNTEVVNGILDAIVANPYVMRHVPMLLRDQDLTLSAFLPEVHAEAGEGAFFTNMAESYVPIAVKSETVSSATAERWLSEQRDASANGTFFGACNYYAFIARKPD